MNHHPLVQCSVDHIAMRTADFDTTHQRSAMFELGVVAEILLAAPHAPGFALPACLLGNAAAGWIRSGLLEETICAHTETAYYAILLTRLALEHCDSVNEDPRPDAARIVALVLRDNELPPTTGYTIWSHLDKMSLARGGDPPRPSEIRLFNDKRVLRRRTDESDVSALHMAAHLVHDGRLAAHEAPATFPHIALLQACRDGDINRICVLLLLNTTAFGPPVWLVDHANATLRQTELPPDMLLPPPHKSSDHDEFRDRMLAGLQLRGTLACGALLTTQTERT